MRTNLVQTCKTSANRINLNRITMRVALIGLFISLGIGNAWAHSKHYGKATLVNATGNGTVYLSTAADKNSGQSGSSTPGTINGTSYITWNCGEDSDKDSKTYYARGTANNGYYYAGWATSSSATTYTAAATGKSFTATSTTEGSPNETKIYGFFKPVTIPSVATPSPNHFDATNTATTCLDYTGTVVFTTANADAIADFQTPTITNKSGNGNYTVTSYTYESNKVTVSYKFTGDGTYGGTNRSNSATITLTSAGGENSRTSTAITASYPNAKILSGSAEEIYATFKTADATQNGVQRTAVFDVELVDGTDNFDTPSITGTGASHFSYNSMSYADGKLTVTYTYNGNKEAGDHTATLTLKVNDAIGGTDATYGSKSVTLTAHNEQESDYDVEVYNASGTKISDNTTMWADGLDLANNNAGSTLKLMRNIDLGTLSAYQSVTTNITLDLNGKTLSATVNGTIPCVLYVNKASRTLTIIDSKTGGKISATGARNNALYGVFVNNGNVVLNSGTIEITNTNTSQTTADRLYATGVYVNAGKTFTMNGGTIVSHRAARDAYGVYVHGTATARGVATINGGTINVTSNTYAYGIRGYGDIEINGGTIHAETLIGAVAYGVQLRASANATASSGFYGELTMTGGTIDVVTKTTDAYGVFADRHRAGTGTTTSVDGTHSNQETGLINITGGTIKATTTTTKAYGVMAYGSFSSKDNKHITHIIKNATIEASATGTAVGICANAEINGTVGACHHADFELTDCTVTAEARTSTTAYCVQGVATATTIYKADQPNYYGEYASAAKITINSGTYTATVKNYAAYTVSTSTRARSTFGAEDKDNRTLSGAAEGLVELNIHGGTFTAISNTNGDGKHTRAISSGGNTTIDGGTFTAIGQGRYVRCIYGVSGTLKLSGITINATSYGTHNSADNGAADCAGVFLDCGIPFTGFDYRCEGEINNCNITVTANKGYGAYGVYANCTSRTFDREYLRKDSVDNSWSTATYDIYEKFYPREDKSIAGKCTINGGQITVKTLGIYNSFGVYMGGPTFGQNGQSAAYGELTAKNTTIEATSNTTGAYGIRTSGPSTISNVNATVTATTSSSYGVYVNAGEANVTNSKFDVTSKTTTAYGMYANAGLASNTSATTSKIGGVTVTIIPTYNYAIPYYGELVAGEGNEVNVKTQGGNTSYAIYVHAAKADWSNTTTYHNAAGEYAIAATATINGGKYTATASGTTAYAACVADPVLQGEATATPTLIINGGKFKGTAGATPFADVSLAGEPGYFVLNGGYYVKDENLDKKLGEGMNKVAVKSGTPEYTEGYRWRVTDNMTGEIVCKVYNGNTLLKSYQTLEEALAYVNLPANSSTAMTIVMCGNYTLSKGDYSLPNGKTLLVPYKASGTGKGATQAVGTSYVWVNYETKYIKPTPLYKLTFASGVNMTVESGAAIEASSVIYITNGASGQGASLLVEGTGIVHDKYGWIDLEEGSHIDLESGSNLYVWGYITGKGEINAKNGSKIYEDFQMGDWRGGTYELKVQGNEYGLNNKGVFPITHYYYQNIECPITYRAGATAYALGGTAVNAFGATNAVTNPAVQFIGTSNSMFLMDPATAGEDTWVRKEYDPETDYMNWTLNSGARIGSISLKMSAMGLDINLNSSDYVLPITSNFNIIANYGQVEISNDVCFIPGSKLTIKKEATVIIPSGKRVYFYDQDDWKSYGGYWFNPGYSPSWKTNPRRVLGANTSIKMPDAAVLVEGVLDIRGYAYTTAGGANIYSTRENAGKVKFTAAAPASTAAEADFTSGTHNSTLYQWTASNVNSDGNVHFEGKALNAPWLKNEDGAFSQTTGTTTNKTWIYMEDDDHVYRWILSYEDGCFTYKNNGGGEKQLIHPSDWVAAEINTNGDHAYHSEDGTRMFVNAKAATSNASCVWWEVDPTPKVISGTTYYVANNENFDNFGTYFYWDGSNSYWIPKKITVTWNNWNGSKLTNGTYGDAYNFNTSPVYQGTNPTKANTTTEKYDWIGWRDAEGNIYDRNATLPRATSDVVYTAYFVATKYQHTITFKNKDDNKVIWSGLMDAGTTPVCPVAPTQDPTVAWVYTFTNWEGYAANADLPTVTEPATYTAIYSSAPRQYTVTFYNYDAASVLYETDVDYNTRPVYAGVTPFRANTSAYSYEWTGWRQGANTYDTDDDLAFVTGDVYYVATFSQTDLKYQVLFKRQDGSIIDAPFFNFEETPMAFPANPTLASTVSTDYTFDHWDPATLQPVTVDGMVYTAYFSETTRQYTARFVNYNGVSLNADQTIDYNTVPAYTGATPIKPNDSRNSYEFSGWAWEAGDGWEAGSIGLGEAFPAIKGDITFTAQYTPTLLQFDVIYQREDGTVILRDKKKWGESTAFPTSGLDYEDATYSYTFDHWSPATLVNPVTTDATYTAYYNRSVKTYSFSSIAATPAGYGTVSQELLASIPGGSTVTVNGNQISVNGTTITATPAAATAQYTYAFDHWNNVPATVTGNVSIEAVFTRTVNQYDVTFNMKGHGAAISSQTKDYGSKVDQPADPSEAGYTFVGWYKEDACTNAWNFASDEVTDATTLFAKWTVNSYTITFDSDGGSEVASITQNYGTAVTPPANPTRTGYTFAGWLPEVPATMPVDGATCVAQWTINSYQVKFVDEDGTTNLGSYPQTLDYGAAVTAPEEPTKAADATNVYTFAGWSDGVSTYASADIPDVSGAVTYTATYNSAPTVASVTVSGATTYYATLQAAFDYAANKTTPTIKVLADIALAAKVTYTNTSKTTVTIDLNGHTVSGALNPLLTLTSASSTGGLIVIKSSVEGGQIRNVVSSNAARACVVLSKGKLRFESGKIYMENKSASSSVQAYGIQVGSSRTFTMIDGTVEVKSTKHAYAIYSYGTTNIEGGELIVTETKNGYAAGVHVVNGTATISENPPITVSGTKYVNGVRVGGLTPAINSGKTAVTMYNGVANIEGGTYTVTASSNTAYGVYCYGNTFKVDYATNATLAGNYANGGTANVRGGVFEVTSGGATAYGVCLQTPATIQTALDADGNATYDAATTQPKANITGGKFNISGTSEKGAVNTTAANTDLVVEGGWYNDVTNLATKYTAPAKSCNYHVLPLTGKDPYKYEVAEAYTITFNNYDGSTLQSGAVKKDATPAYSGATPTKTEDESYTYSFTGWSPAITTVSTAATYTATFSSTPRTYAVTLHTNGGTINAGDVTKYTYGTGATLPTNVTKDGHEFGGWFDNDGLTGDAVTTISTTATGNKEYWAKWTASIADRELDIVDWTSNSITINVTNLKAVGGTNKNNWAIRINDTDYPRTTTTFNADRTLTVTGLSLTPNENLLIQLKNDASVIESQHNYKIPQIYTANATLSGTPSSSVVYVYGGKLTISGDITLAALYVCPGAEVEVTGTLNVGKLVLRTKPWATAAISGSVTATNVYYTRIAPDGSASYPTGKYYQFGLPYECDINDVLLSDGTTPAYNTTWILKSYNEQRRAESGTENNNWDALAADATIEAGRGYEMFSSYKYYREYYFPVTPTDNTSVDVTRHGEDKNNSGWNIVCSPLMSIYQNESDPVTGLKVSWLLTDGSYDQEWPATIWPALPFSYQASATGYLDFSTNEFNQAVSAPRRAAYKEDIQTEWLHLDVKDGNGVGDHTSVFVHPDRFEATYKTGIDVAKQSFTASRALVYSSHAYGEMAFAGVADVLLENGVALTVYSPKEQELTISMRDNEWLDRMAYVWLIDNETGAQIDLLDSDYTFEATAGTTTGRFILMGRFFAPQIATDIDEVDGEQAKPKKLIIRDKLYILINDQLYDGTGKMVK